jgi:spermidine/putrescine transport system substrate-binding protein
MDSFGSLSRRGLLQRGAGVAALGVAAPLLAACGDDDDDDGGSTSGADKAQVGGTIGFFGFEGMDFPQVLKGFNAKHGIDFASKYIGSPGEVAAMFAGGRGSDIDILAFSAVGTKGLVDAGVELQPIDVERIPNWKNVEQFIGYCGAEGLSNRDGEIVGAPLAWSTLGITYDSKAIPEPKACADLRDPSFKGKLTMLDDFNTNYGLTAIVLGIDATQMTSDDLDRMNDFLRPILANTRKLSPTYGDMASAFASGDVVAAYAGWAAVNLFAADAGNTAVKTNNEPEDGGGASVECYGIAPDCDNLDTVYAIINELLGTKVNAAAATAVVGAPTVPGAQRLQPPPVRSLYPPESGLADYWAKNSIAVEAPVASDEYVTIGQLAEAWARLKADV